MGDCNQHQIMVCGLPEIVTKCCAGTDGPLRRAHVPTRTETLPFLAPQNGHFGLDLGIGCKNPSLTPVQKYVIYTGPILSVPTRTNLRSSSISFGPQMVNNRTQAARPQYRKNLVVGVAGADGVVGVVVAVRAGAGALAWVWIGKKKLPRSQYGPAGGGWHWCPSCSPCPASQLVCCCSPRRTTHAVYAVPQGPQAPSEAQRSWLEEKVGGRSSGTAKGKNTRGGGGRQVGPPVHCKT